MIGEKNSECYLFGTLIPLRSTLFAFVDVSFVVFVVSKDGWRMETTNASLSPLSLVTSVILLTCDSYTWLKCSGVNSLSSICVVIYGVVCAVFCDIVCANMLYDCDDVFAVVIFIMSGGF